MNRLSPIFIVGAARSGTTALATALQQGAGYSGFGEGHFLPLLGQLSGRVRGYYRNKSAPARDSRCLLSHVPEEKVISALRERFREWCEAACGNQPWFDKTPDSAMIMTCPDIMAIWPMAFILHAKRRPIDNVLSRLQKFEGLSFENACQEWVRCTRGWESVRTLLGGRFLEIDQLDMIRKTDSVAAAVAAAIGLEPTMEARFAEVLRSFRPERTSSTDWTPLSETAWTTAQIEVFRRLCGESMASTGYGEQQYWSSRTLS